MLPGQTPTAQPGLLPGQSPTAKPSGLDSGNTPTAQPGLLPGQSPTAQPGQLPGQSPTAQPGQLPGQSPTAQPGLLPGQSPTAQPGLLPGQSPTAQPGLLPGQSPTAQPGILPGQTPSAAPLICETKKKWSMWINRHTVSSPMDNDIEKMMPGELDRFCRYGTITDVECTALDETPYDKTGDIVTCTKEKGLLCDSFRNFPLGCKDYQIRYSCTEQVCQSKLTYYIFSSFNPFPNKPWFLRVCSRDLLKTLREKEKLLVTSNFSFSHSVFYLFG